jgi:hypothetical protein
MIGAANVAARKERAPMMCPGCCFLWDRLLGLVLRFRISRLIAATSFANFEIKAALVAGGGLYEFDYSASLSVSPVRMRNA